MRAIHLRELRERRGLTQEQLEACSGVAQPIISRLENDPEANPAWTTVAKLAAALAIDPRELRFGPPAAAGSAR